MSTEDSEPEETASVISYEPGSGRWAEVSPMHQSRGFLRMAAAGNYIYAIGGNHGGDTVPTVERYDPGSDTWTTVAPMNQDRGVPGAVVISHDSTDQILVVGGTHIAGSVAGTLTSTEIYHPGTDRWQTLTARLAEPRTSLVCALEADGTVLAMGGEVPSNGSTKASSTVEGLRLTEHEYSQGQSAALDPRDMDDR